MDLHPPAVVPLAEAAAIAHRHGLPLILDAAAELPPAGNLSDGMQETLRDVLTAGRVLIRDADGNPYEIQDYRRLDPASQELIEGQI